MKTLTPRKIVEELDRYIIGQNKAKRTVAIALRNPAGEDALNILLIFRIGGQDIFQ